MGSDQRKRPQMTTVVDAEKRALAVAIARRKGESDAIGVGYSAVVRKEMDRYINRYRDVLTDEDLREVEKSLGRPLRD